MSLLFFFFFNDTATTEIYTLSLHDALPILTEQAIEQTRLAGVGRAVNNGAQSLAQNASLIGSREQGAHLFTDRSEPSADRKSTRLNSSHSQISYAVFCLKKKNTIQTMSTLR